MPIVGDYRIIRDGAFSLNTAGDIDREFRFGLPGLTRRDFSMILQWVYVSSQNARNLNFRMEVNGQEVRSLTVNGNFFGTMHEVFPGDQTREDNEFKARIIGGTGSVDISDVVLFFQRDT